MKRYAGGIGTTDVLVIVLLVTQEELMGRLLENGVDDIAQVKRAYRKQTGCSVITRWRGRG